MSSVDTEPIHTATLDATGLKHMFVIKWKYQYALTSQQIQFCTGALEINGSVHFDLSKSFASSFPWRSFGIIEQDLDLVKGNGALIKILTITRRPCEHTLEKSTDIY